MPSNSRLATPRRALAAAVALTLAMPAAADWMRDYQQGKKAFEDGDFAAAETAMNNALRQDNKASARRRFQGTTFAPYLPHFYAGMAAYRQGACDRALGLFQSPANLAVLGEVADLASQQDRALGDCQAKIAAAQTPKPVEPPVQVAIATPPKPTPVPPPQPTPVVKPPPVPTPTVAAPVVAVGSPAPALLASAVDAYLTGRYADIERSNPSALPSPRDRAQLLLFRAAARFLAAELSGGTTTTLDTARADIRAAKQVQPALQPDAALFSPRFRMFWRDTR